MKRQLTALMLSGAMLFALGIQAAAVEGDGEFNLISQEIQKLPASVLYYGRVTHIQKDEQGVIVRLVMESERYGAYIMNIDQDTVWIDSGNRTADDPNDLQEGEGLYVFHSSVSTRSMPPQATAFAVVRNIPMDVGCAMHHRAEDVTMLEDGGVRILTDQGGLFISAPKDTGVSAYQSDKAVSLDDIKPGMAIMAWYDNVQETYPAQTSASHIMVLPGAAEETNPVENVKPLEGAQLTLELDGNIIKLPGRYENGTAMIPVAAVARALGLEANYTHTGDGPLVTVESDSFAVYMDIRSSLVFGSTKLEGMAGTTGPQSYGKAPYIVEPRRHLGPAEIFQMLGKTVTLEGTNLIIK